MSIQKRNLRAARPSVVARWLSARSGARVEYQERDLLGDFKQIGDPRKPDCRPDAFDLALGFARDLECALVMQKTSCY